MARRSWTYRRRCVALVLVWLATLLFPGLLQAKLPITSKACKACHTMHNIENNQLVVAGGSPKNLLKNSCVGCHSSAGKETISAVGNVPIVFNTDKQPTQPLAGGNFWWVVNKGNEYGHNVAPICYKDTITAPGGQNVSCTDSANTCHNTLANTTQFTVGQNGCKACHMSIKHHQANKAFCGLWGHGGVDKATDTKSKDYVIGWAVADWEQNAKSDSHNEYKGVGDVTGDYDPTKGKDSDCLGNKQTITAFCLGCHPNMHRKYRALTFDDGSNGYTCWLIHPVDCYLEETGDPDTPSADQDFKDYTKYNPQVPVARDWAESSFWECSSNVAFSDVVMCLSCHRGMASEYPHLLRWKYDEIYQQPVAPAKDTVNPTTGGCCVCHTAKCKS
ncbi:MAG: cytochrome c3 family protein [Pseudomonadota bacterium]